MAYKVKYFLRYVEAKVKFPTKRRGVKNADKYSKYDLSQYISDIEKEDYSHYLSYERDAIVLYHAYGKIKDCDDNLIGKELKKN